jgi:peptidoglycan/LPS O-acetylase OafA/YrhL
MQQVSLRGDVEGIRAVAVASVVAYHAGLSALPGGFVGVDVFFVVSGYLMASILGREERLDLAALAGYATRRVLRLAPALLLVGAATTAAAAALFLPQDMVRAAESVLPAVLFYSNVHFYHEADYFTDAARLHPLLHTWSLSVEMQFYLTFPLVILAGRRLGRPRAAVALFGAASLAGAVAAVPHAADAAFYLYPLRAWEMAAGALAAMGALPVAQRRAVREASAAAGLGMVLASAALLGPASPFPGLLALPACAGTALLLHAGASGGSAVSRVLAAAPLAGVGRLSYAVYLWHWPVLVFARHLSGADALGAAETAAAVALSVLLAVPTLALVEEPCRRAARTRPRRSLAGAAAASAALVAVGAHAVGSGGWPGRIPPEVAARYDAERRDRSPDLERCHGHDARPIPFAEKCRYGPPGADPEAAIWGDSHAGEVGRALGDALASEGRSLLYVSYSSCPPALGLFGSSRPACSRHNAETAERLAADRRIRTVVLVARYAYYEQVAAAEFRAGLEATVRTLAAGGTRVVLILPVPEPGLDVPLRRARETLLGREFAEVAPPAGDLGLRLDRIRAFLLGLADGERVVAVDPAAVLCGGGACRVELDGRALYLDDNHLSMTGARLLVPSLLAALAEAR